MAYAQRFLKPYGTIVCRQRLAASAVIERNRVTMTSLPFEPAPNQSEATDAGQDQTRHALLLLARRAALAMLLMIAIVYWRDSGIW
ncbi:hypothetical protein [Rhizobium sp. RU35A]|nr:hypothetical protein [Rhizobium sp. RU35A]